MNKTAAQHPQPARDQHETGEAEPMSRATPLLIHTTLPLRDLLLDPGDELSITQDPAGMPDASFVRAFVPLRAYQRLSAGGLDGLKQKIQKYPESLVRRILARADGEGSQHVVIDGSWHVAALRHLAEHGPLHRAPLAPVVTELFDACPVTIVPPTTDPALVLALLADPVHHHADPWVRGQRDRLLADLLVSGVHHSKEAVVEALDGDQHAMRRYHAFRALQQLMQHRHVQLHEAPDLYPLFHAAVGRQAIRTWLDWDDGLWCFLDDVALEHFHRMIAPYPAADGAPGGACIRTVDDIVHLCDVLGEPEALRMITDGGRTLHEAVEFINGGAFRHRAGQVSGANAPAQPDRRGIRRNPDH